MSAPRAAAADKGKKRGTLCPLCSPSALRPVVAPELVEVVAQGQNSGPILRLSLLQPIPPERRVDTGDKVDQLAVKAC
jgi:hypothetical protein